MPHCVYQLVSIFFFGAEQWVYQLFTENSCLLLLLLETGLMRALRLHQTSKVVSC